MTNEKVYKFIATLGPVGYFPVAPGTAGTAVALLFYILMKPGTSMLLVLFPLLFWAGIIASTAAEKSLGKKDASCIVIDEFAGYLVSVLLLPYSIVNALIAFLLFRVFDIFKPFPIRSLDQKIPGGLGVMADDVLAGLYANLLLRVFLYFS